MAETFSAAASHHHREQENANKLASAMRGLQWKPKHDESGAIIKHPPEVVPAAAKMGRKPIATTSMVPLRGRHHDIGEQQLFANTEESIMVKRIKELHAPEGMEIPYDSKYVLLIIEEIILRASIAVPGIEQHERIEARLEAVEGEILNSGMTELRDELAYPVNKIASELMCKSDNEDWRQITQELFKELAHFAWEAKVVIAFAAFAKMYGEYWLVADLFRTNPLARSVGILMEVDEIVGTHHIEAFKPKFRAITDLVNATLDITKSIFEFNDLLSKSAIAADDAERIASNLHVPVAAYWTVRSIVACSSILMNLMAMGHEYITSSLEAWELSTLKNKLGQIKDHMDHMRREYEKRIEEKRQIDIYLALIKIYETPQLDNMKFLRGLLCNFNDEHQLYDGTLKSQGRLEVLRKKSVLLLISGLHIPPQEFDILIQLYGESRHPSISHENKYELVWLPVIDIEEPPLESLQKFQYLRDQMPWYSVADPRLIAPGVIRFVKEFFGYENRPVLIVLDPLGRVVNFNAFNMLWIWGSMASPFTNAREQALWNEASWNMDLLVDSIDPTVPTWLTSGKFVCLYGGDDLEWIQKFTAAARNIARQLNIDLEMVYVGKANPNERIKRINEAIQRENLSYTFPDISNIWFFWVRLNCMWNSREKHDMAVEYDEKMKQVITILTYDSTDIEWAIFGKGGTGETAKHTGEVVLQCLEDFIAWRDQVIENNQAFVQVLDEEFRKRHPKTHCHRLFYPGTTMHAPPTVICPECSRPMDKHLMYRCCID